MRRIVAAVDFSPVTDAVIMRASELARAFSAELILIHVAAPDPDFVGYGVGPETERVGRARELRDEHRDLQQRARSLREEGVDARALLIQGPVVEKLLEECERIGVDALVIGSRADGMLRRAFLGSVSESVSRRASCIVMLVPPEPDPAA